MSLGIISAPQPEAAEAGADILKAGGNAIDAAIGCALVQTIVDPQMCGIAGFGSMHIFKPRDEIHICLDFHGRAPLNATEEMWKDFIQEETEDGFGFILTNRANEIGYQSITAPMSLNAFATALEKYGTKSISELIEPAINYASQGFLIRPHVHYFWNLKEKTGRIPQIQKFQSNKVSRNLYFKKNGELLKPGDLLKNEDISKTYRRIAKFGVKDFYFGKIAKEIVKDMENNSGLINAKDLAEALPSVSKPLWGSYRNFKIATNPPPGGGIMLIQMLNILENFNLKEMGHNSAIFIATVSEAMKLATVDKDKFVGDPKFVDVPICKLTSKDYALKLAKEIQAGQRCSVPRFVSGGEEPKDTTQVTVVDKNNNCVSLTHSLGMPSGVVTEGLGFMYNGCMSVFDPRPGRASSIAPGKARFSAIAPTILFLNQKPFYVVGAPGGTFITMGILQAIINTIDFKMDAQKSVSAPRFCTTSNKIDISNRILRSVEQDLNRMGYETNRSYLSHHFAGVHSVRILNENWDGGADPGRDGMVIEV